MKNLMILSLTLLCLQVTYAQNYQHCQTRNGELEFILPIGEKHLFLAPHSLSSNQRQLASLKTGEKANVTDWETLHYKNDKKFNHFSQKNLNFKSDFNSFIEISMNDGKAHTYSIKCAKI
jgi:hypothetical protein